MISAYSPNDPDCSNIVIKKVAVITRYESIAQLHAKTLKQLFLDYVELTFYSLEDDLVTEPIEADLVICSLNAVYAEVKDYIPKNTPVTILRVTMTTDQFNSILKVPKNKQVLLVSYCSEMAVETLALLKQAGIKHINPIPVFPGSQHTPKLDTAITFGETQHVPDFVKTIINLGDRILDVETIVEVAFKLNLDFLLKSDNLRSYFSQIKTHEAGLFSIFGKNISLESKLDNLLDLMEDGIIAVDAGCIIHALNQTAERIMGVDKVQIVGKNIKKVISVINWEEVYQKGKEIFQLIRMNEMDVSLKVLPVRTMDHITGTLVVISKFSEKEKAQHKLRLQLLNKGHQAKYKFEDIFTQNTKMEALKAIAFRMAKSDSSILITGESGTGKELFAQSIHNASSRSQFQFVAINCAALPANLLESELFGYEDGAFTGARKGGKPGLFELAHKGTLFLDEVGEIPADIQPRLLRALQERAVMRIGGDTIIKVDIRIIAATNQELGLLINQGKFRRDLFFRLSVLPIKTIPLRERKEDIIPTLKFLQKELQTRFDLSKAAKKVIIGNRWDGNVRELRNVTEYLAHLDKRIVDIEDLPHNLINTPVNIHSTTTFSHSTALEKQSIEFDQTHEFEKYVFVLQCLYNAHLLKQKCGRRSIVKQAEGHQFSISEQDVRNIFADLQKHHFISIGKGRGGSMITEAGKAYFLETAAKK